MKTRPWQVLALLFLIPGLACSSDTQMVEEESSLWPEIEPFRTEYLKVSDIHEIYFELCGNPEGKPVFVLHGGPGAGCSPYMRRFLNPEVFLIVLHDQRGAGRSRPHAETRENTTHDLIEDIERVRKQLELGRIILFGGSWGSTLALAYAEAYPENVSGMVLRGVFTATAEEIEHYYHGGVRTFFPEAYDELIRALPEPERRPLPDYLLELVRSENPETGGEWSRAWATYEGRISMLEVPDELMERIKASMSGRGMHTFSLLENYYMANDCFLEEGQLLSETDRIRSIPLTMVNGRYDMICPPIAAYRLHEKLPGSKLVIVEGAGHWMGDSPVERALLNAMKEFE